MNTDTIAETTADTGVDAAVTPESMTPQSTTTDPRVRLVALHLVPLGDGKLQLRSPSRTAVLSGPLAQRVLPRVLPLLDGTRTRAQVADALAGELDRTQVLDVITALAAKGFVTDVPPLDAELFPHGSADHYETVARFFEQSEPRYRALTALRRAHVLVAGGGPVTGAVVRALTHLGLGRVTLIGNRVVSALDLQQSSLFTSEDLGRPWVDTFASRFQPTKLGCRVTGQTVVPTTKLEWQAALRDVTMGVVVVDGPVLFHPWVETFNAAAVAQGIPWVAAAVLDSRVVHVGPTITPGLSACYKCFELRFKSNLSFLDAYSAFERFVQESRDLADTGVLPPAAEIVGNVAALDVVRAIAPEQIPVTAGKLLTINLATFATDLHPVLKLPRCPACSPVHHTPRERIWS